MKIQIPEEETKQHLTKNFSFAPILLNQHVFEAIDEFNDFCKQVCIRWTIYHRPILCVMPCTSLAQKTLVGKKWRLNWDFVFQMPQVDMGGLQHLVSGRSYRMSREGPITTILRRAWASGRSPQNRFPAHCCSTISTRPISAKKNV